MALNGQVTDDAGFIPWVSLMGPKRAPVRLARLYNWMERRSSELSFVIHTWGTTEEDRALEFPCESYFEPPLYGYYRAIEVLAPSDVVFRWLCQLRVGTYGGFDLIDNFGRRSPRELTPGADQLESGQRILTMFELVEFAHGESISMRAAMPFSLFFGQVGVTYRVVPSGASRCRIVTRAVAPVKGHAWRRELFPIAELQLMRSQLQTLKQLAEKQYLEELVLAGRPLPDSP